VKLSIIIPVYNEKKTIEKSVERVIKADLGKDVEKEIIVVDDGSKDGTISAIEELAKKHKNVMVVKHPKNKGKSWALRTGFGVMTGDVVVIHDADLEYDPNDLKPMVEKIREKGVEVVYGSRRLEKTNIQYSGLSFYVGGLFLTYFVNVLYGASITDEPTCYKMFRSNLLRTLDIKAQKFEFCPEATAKVLKKGIKIFEVPISYTPRKANQGKKIKLKDFFEAVWVLIKYRFVN
jgi:dolichol-phosphate mannosyltransferase